MAITNEGDSQSFAYTGGMQSFTAPQKGIYRLEVWGARGAPGHGGGYHCGGYGCGYRLMEKGEVIYICCGQAGSQGAKAFSYNGGATGAANAGALGGSGGGATHMATMTGTLEAIGSGNLSKILVVAGGSGGGNRGWGGYKASGTAGGGAQSDTCGDSSVFGKGVAGTASTWLDRPEMMSDSPCVRGNCSTPKMGEIRLISNPTLKGPLFSETGQYISFATI